SAAVGSRPLRCMVAPPGLPPHRSHRSGLVKRRAEAARSSRRRPRSLALAQTRAGCMWITKRLTESSGRGHYNVWRGWGMEVVMLAPLNIAHAACKGHAPENTLAGIRAALALGVDAIEIDVHCTSDGIPILMHDATVDRTTNGAGAIREMTLD